MLEAADTANPAARDNKTDGATPMIAQYIEIKAANPDCLLFYRMGDFYELFFEDSLVASRALGIMLTKRGKYRGEDIPMCGVPVERANDYLQKLIGLGHRVAVCEQLEDPAEAKKRGAKSVVRRDVTHLSPPARSPRRRYSTPPAPMPSPRWRGFARRTAAGLSASPASIFRPAPFPSSTARQPISAASWRGSTRAKSSSPRRCFAIPNCAKFWTVAARR